MIAVHYPEPRFRMKETGGKRYLFDEIRRFWVLLTEEEWVRQNFVHYLIHVLGYPATTVALEKEILVNGLKKRFDILVYDKNLHPWMLVECKEPAVSLDETVLQQALRYNLTVPVPYLILTNGTHTLGWKKEADSLVLLQELPAWNL